MRIRPAGAADAGPLAALADSTFRDAFEGVNAATDIDLHCRTHYGEALQAREIADPAMLTLLCEQDALLAGYAQLRWGPAPPCVVAHAPGEIQRLYVARDWHGRGVAQALMGASLSALAERGSDVAWLGVWEQNPRAIAFYRKSGFRAVGEHVFTVGTDPQRDVVMTRSIERS